MDFSMAIRSYSESVVGIVAETLTINRVSINKAWIRPARNPIGEQSVDVTRAFVDMVSADGVFVNQKVSPSDLLPKRQSSGGGGAWSWVPFLRRSCPQSPPLRPRCNDDKEQEEEEWWLCVLFSMPGGCKYTAPYTIPSELVTFPPLITSHAQFIVPLCAQVISAEFVFSTKEEEEEEDDDDDKVIAMDFTEQLREMIGPDGFAFGRGEVDVELAMSNSLDSMDEKEKDATLRSILGYTMSMGRAGCVRIETADGDVERASSSLWKIPSSHSSPKKIYSDE